ncbi:MAG: hypothetical protein OEQ53_09490 [Saprospiraceae bacterium]|nr:hypothetical protein [Saprospiraceae bacterium]
MNLPQIVVISLSTLIISCTILPCGPTKDAFLDKYDAFIEKVDRADMHISDEEWEKYDSEFKKFVEECYELHGDDLSTKEKRKFWIKSLKYYAVRYGEGMLNEMSEEDTELDITIRENVGEVLELTGEELSAFFEKNGEELEELLESISADIEAWAEKIQEIFEVDE